MKSIMQTGHKFSMAPQAKIERSVFDRSHGLKTTFDEGFLVPIFLDEVLPGDTFNLKATILARLATPIFPFMDNIFLNTFFFSIPNRLLWRVGINAENSFIYTPSNGSSGSWEEFMGQNFNGIDYGPINGDFYIPTLQFADGDPTFESLSLADYFGLPVGKVINTRSGEQLQRVSALPFRAYNLIWNEHFRDQNLQPPVFVQADNGPDAYEYYTTYGANNEKLLRRGKRHDYFTSCLPWPQKGPAITVPLGESAPVMWYDGSDYSKNYFQADEIIGDLGTAIPQLGLGLNTPLFANTAATVTSPHIQFRQAAVGPDGNAIADLTSATATTINQLRLAFQMQKLYERDARGGTRYDEIILAHFNVVSPDARLQRTEYLGGGQSPVNVHPVAQTSVTAATPQGNLAAFATSLAHGHGFTKSFTEHGLVMGLVSVRADLTYQQGLNRMWTRLEKFDFFWPALAHIGEQAVLNQEIYTQGTANLAEDQEVFGYQEAWAEYRYKPSQITGLFRSNVTTGYTTLDEWHLSQDFGSLPTLGEAFIEDTPPISRVVAVDNQPHFIMDAYFDLKCTRPMPTYSVPGFIDHF